MATGNPSASAPPIDAVVAALDRLAGDLRRRTEEAESRAEAAERQVELEREARHSAEARAAMSEQGARDALQRAQAIERAMRESVEQLRRDLLAAIHQAVDATQATTAAVQAAPGPDRSYAERPMRASVRDDPELAYIPEPEAGRLSESSQPAPRRWGKEREYAWIEDEPGPSWWRRLFGRY